MNVNDEPAEPPFWKKFCPNLAVYLPKYVTVHNPRLGLLNAVLSLLCVILTLYYFVSNDKYLISKVPETHLSVCGEYCSYYPAEQDIIVDTAKTRAYCNGTTLSTTHDNQTYENVQCVGRCGASSGQPSCIHGREFIQTKAQWAFIPTFYQETFFAENTSGTSCPAGLNYDAGLCQRSGSYYVAGAEETRLVFNHEFTVTPHKNSLNMIYDVHDLKSHSGSFNSQGWDKGMVTVLFSHEGQEMARFEQGHGVNLTLHEVLSAASYQEAEGQMSLDSRYSPLGSDQDVPLRLTGASITIDLYTTDRGECPVYDTFQHTVRKIPVERGRPITCVLVYVDRRWVSQEISNPVPGSGLRVRRIHGMEVNFRKMGKFSFLDEQQIISNLTVFFVWIQLPLSMTYWFCVLFLGMLSKIYSRVLHQELNLADACKGLVARLMCHSAAYFDLMDNAKGISKDRIRDRFRDYLASHENIDEGELNRFVEFVFGGLKSNWEGHPESDCEHVSLQEFCEVCASNEPLNFQVLVRLFDKDRIVGPLERFFIDKSLRDVLDQQREAQDDDADTKLGGGSHSRVDTAITEVQQMMDDLKDMEAKSMKVARDLEIGDDVQELIGGNANSTVAGKAAVFSQNADNYECDSIGDEAMAEGEQKPEDAHAAARRSGGTTRLCGELAGEILGAAQAEPESAPAPPGRITVNRDHT